MKSKQLISIYIFLMAFGTLFWIGCKKDKGDYSYTNTQKVFSGDTYEFLKSKSGLFDSLLFVIDRLGLKDTLKNKNVTLFAVTNTGFQLAAQTYNIARVKSGLTPLYLSNYSLSQLDSMMCRYIVRGSQPADSMTNVNGRTLIGVKYGYPMNGKSSIANANGQVGGGASSIILSQTNKSVSVQNWQQATASSINISTKNGYVHILDPEHVFGFSNYSKPVSLPFKGIAFMFPATTNPLDSIIIEAEDFDNGGQGISYSDFDTSNKGGNYRPTEGVDLYAQAAQTVRGVQYPAGFRIGSFVAGEWVNYSINVAVEGDYKIFVRYGAPSVVSTGNSPGAFHLSIDWKDVTGRISAPVTGPVNNNTSFAALPVILHLKPGPQYFTFSLDVQTMELESFVIKRIN